MKTLRKMLIMAVLYAVPLLLAYSGSDKGDSRTKSFTVAKGGTLEVDVEGGDIKINVWDKNEVSVKADGIDEENIDRLKMTQSGNDVRVDFHVRDRWGWGSNHLRFEITVPSQYNANLHTSGGDIEIRNGLNGKVKGSTSGGDVILGNMSGGVVDMSTSGGNMRAGDVQGDVTLRTSGGNIDLGNVKGEANVKTSGGNITAKSVGKSLHASTSGGDIEIGDVGGEAKLSTSGGNVRVQKVTGSATMTSSGGDIELEGASGRVKASTSGGNVNLTNITGTIEAGTSGGDVNAELRPTGQGRSKLSSAGGEITLSIPEDAKATIEATIRIQDRWMRRKDDYKVRSEFKSDTYDSHNDEIHAVYTLNGGGDVIELKTVNSDITIKKLHR